MNIEKCFSDLSNVKSELQSFLSQPISLASALAEISKLKPMFATLLSDCTFGLEAVNSSSDVLLTTLDRDLIKCVGDIASLAPAITKLVVDGTKKDLPAIISDVTTIVQDVGTCLKDCFQ